MPRSVLTVSRVPVGARQDPHAGSGPVAVVALATGVVPGLVGLFVVGHFFAIRETLVLRSGLNLWRHLPSRALEKTAFRPSIHSIEKRSILTRPLIYLLTIPLSETHIHKSKDGRMMALWTGLTSFSSLPPSLPRI